MKFFFLFSICLLPVVSLGQEKINDFEELANGYYGQKKYVQAAEFYSKAGYAYWNKNNHKQAESAFQKAFDLFSGQGNITASITVGNNLGLIYSDEENYKEAYTAFNNVLKFSRKTKNADEIYNALINLGTVAFELSSFNDAISKITEAFSLAKEVNNLKYLAKCYSLLAECYEKMGDSSNAYKYFELYSSIDQKIKKQEMDDMKQMSEEEVNDAQQKKRITEIELKIKKGELKLTQDSLGVAERLAYERQMQVELRNEQLKQKEMQLRYERHLRQILVGGISVTVIFLLVLGILLKQKLRDNNTLRSQKEEITLQRNKLNQQNKKITDSIQYGLRIQQAMLPNLEIWHKKLDAFVFYRPKDIVSGDFYWFNEVKTDGVIYRFVVLADCTGHGVPGAFMSMIGHRLLSETVIERGIYQPSKVLDLINCNLRKELDQDNKRSMDGMDIAFCRFRIKDGKYDELVYAGAKRPILVHKKDQDVLLTVEGDRKGIGGFISSDSQPFTDQTLEIKTGDAVILYSDGIIDQQDPKRVRYGTRQFVALVNTHRNLSMTEMKRKIENTFDSYRQTEDQRDDLTVIGLRLT